ncbi:cytochrome d ubiquinol oxidase subunit II [Sansalvadorimonas verongulae]|uniref:cytochrome d ubiquinol oxidase subunit II n=1 Tax=Sansalvadorimonas verongulae TaxID=2172824 RepID=UPI0012BCF81B|nr:cytochrome d ubiquinol oxidase subunit II [Sansalvadorimonas verongulae]
MFDYEVLKLIWWLLIGILLIGFAIMDGYDMGAAGLLTFLGKNDTERRVVINAVAPHWDGNQVWLITGAGAIFAAWPTVYATAFNGFYWALLLVLFALMLRPLAFEYRAKLEDHQKKWCDLGLVISGLIPSLIFGVAFGNLFQGFGYNLNEYMMVSYTSGLLDLLNPFALLCGVVSLSMLLMQGATWLSLRTADVVQERASNVARLLATVVLVTFAIGGVWAAQLPGYEITSIIDPNAPSSPLSKVVEFGAVGAWMNNYSQYPLMMLAPAIGFLGSIGVILLIRTKPTLSFLASSLSVGGIVATAGLSLFPFILPSSSNPNVSLTVWDATSSELTLGIMTFVAAVMVPAILCYTSWCFYKMWGRVDAAHIENNTHSLY